MPASPSTARAINDRLALRLLQQEGPLTAGRLKQLTGLSRPTVADLVERLTAAGLITVVGEAGEQRRGPNAKLYGIVADRAHLAALDVRTEGVSVVVTDLVGRELAEASVPIGGDTGTGPAVEQAVTLVERVVKEAGADRLHTVGIGAPGLIDPATGDLRDTSGLPEWHRRLVAALQERLPEARVSVENETNLAALAEQREGAARDRDTFVLLWLSHGTGAAVVLDGALRRGVSGGMGEIGFLPVPGTAGLPSATDCEGGFHSLAGAAAIVGLAGEYGVTVEGVGAEPVAAGVVRGAVAAVSGGGGDAAGALSGGGGDAAGASSGGGEEAAGASSGGGGDAEGAPSEAGKDAARALSGVSGEHAGAPSEGRGGEIGPLSEERGGETGAPSEERGGEEGPRSEERGGEAGAPVEVSRDAVAAPVELSRDAAAVSVEGSRDAVAVPVGVSPDAVVAVASQAGGGVLGDRLVVDAAGRFLDALADRLAVGVASVVAILDPGCVVLGGEVGQAGGEELAARVEARVRRMSPLVTEVRPSLLGGDAVLRGALLTARDRAQDELFGSPER
ncbi:ROK family protein [Streptomyces cylindrosporus]|uniref:ROK family protein n=1 Tax=Streptomyces cylindrosporus TaxID=2927583 RepID=A0ABS9YNI9_9ACTN|nr:ROK family protein [Streptomyces cylindrosporus]MCI3277396.1 ROK family protein [Streptomyces cylindrosporus]